MTRTYSALLWFAVSNIAVGAFAQDNGTPPHSAQAEEPRPRAAVAVLASDDDDRFLEIYLSEVAANVLREAGYDVVSTAATRVRWQARGPECPQQETCLRGLSSELRTPTLILIEARPLPHRRGLRISATARTIHVYSHRIDRLEPQTVDGTEQTVAEALQAYTTRLTELERPCEITVDHPAELEVRAEVDGRPVATLPLFIDPGTHELRIMSPRRTDWEGTLTCASGERWRARVR